MTRTVKYLIAAAAIALTVFLVSMLMADEFSLAGRVITSLLTGASCFAYFQFLARLEARRPPEAPYNGEEDETP